MFKFVVWLLTPLGIGFCLAGLALLLAWRRRPLGSKVFGALTLIWFWIFSIPVTHYWLVSQIENQFSQVPISAVPYAQAIVVLGGTVTPLSDSLTKISLGRTGRVWYAARLFHASKAPLVLITGGGDPERQVFSEARAMIALLQDLGVPEQAIALEEASRDRRQNAAFSAALLKARRIEHILIVTSALQMPRALALFKAQGLQVTPAPTDFETGQEAPTGLSAWLPDAGALNSSALAMNELVGLWAGW